MNMIHPPLMPLAVSIDDLTPDPDNARVHTDRNLDAIAASLRAYGQRKPIVVQRSGMVVRAGNGTVEAARRLGWDKIAAVIIDESNLNATAYGLADNRTAELASWDEAVLARLLGDLHAEDDFDPMALGWEERDVIKLLADYGGMHEDYLDPLDDDATSEGAKLPDAPKGAGSLPVQHPTVADVRMVQLFFTEAQYASFSAALRSLADATGATDVSTVVLQAVLDAASTD